MLDVQEAHHNNIRVCLQAFEGENFPGSIGKEHFVERTFAECLTDRMMGVACLNLRGENFYGCL